MRNSLALPLVLLAVLTAAAADSPDELFQRLEQQLATERITGLAPEVSVILDEVKATHGAESHEMVEAINAVIRKAVDVGGPAVRDAEILALAERGVEIQTTRFGARSRETATSLDRYGVLLEVGGDFEGAERIYLDVLAIRRDLLGPDHGDVVVSLMNLGILEQAQEYNDEAEARFLEAIEQRRAADALDDPRLINAYNRLGVVRWRAGRLTAAAEAFELSRDLVVRLRGEYDEQVGVVDLNLGSLARTADDFELARRHLEHAREVFERSPTTERQLAAARRALATLAIEEGDYGLARDELHTALEIFTRLHGQQSQDVAQTWNWIGNVAYYEGDLLGARDAWALALKLYRGLPRPPSGQWLTVGNLGLAHKSLGDMETAGEYYREELAGSLAAHGEAHLKTAASRRNLAGWLRDVERYEEALPLLEQALSVFREVRGEDHSDTGHTHDGLGRVLLGLDRLDEARQHLERALAIHRVHRDEHHFFVIRSLDALGELHARAGRWSEARDLYARALEAAGPTLPVEHPLHVASRAGLAQALWALGDTKGAVRQASAAGADQDRRLRAILGGLPETVALSLLDKTERPEEIVFAVLGGKGAPPAAALDEAWRFSLRRRGMVLEELSTRARAARDSRDPELEQAWTRLVDARRRLAALWARGPEQDDSHAFRRDLDAARTERSAAEEALATASAPFRALRENRDVTLIDVEAALPKSSVLVEIVRVGVSRPGAQKSEQRDVAMLLHAGGRRDAVDLGTASRNDELTHAWQQALAASAGANASPKLPALRETGRTLRRAVWDPIAGRLGEARTVFFVPDGVFHLFPVTALPGDDDRFLLETGPFVQVIDSGRDLVRGVAPSAAAGRGLLALGNPDFGASGATRLAEVVEGGSDEAYRSAAPSCTGVAGQSWVSLPSSASEVRRVAELLVEEEPAFVWTGSRASEEGFKRFAPGRRVLHVATHGYFLPENACDHAVSPLLRSGLILAGASVPTEDRPDSDDGILTAEEVAALDLGGLELVVLSACESGRGEVAAGEGVFGLRRALNLAGARRIVLNVWPVPDRWSSRWMGTFYKGLAAELSPAEAARKAQLENLAALRAAGRAPHPYRWSGWMTVGTSDGLN